MYVTLCGFWVMSTALSHTGIILGIRHNENFLILKIGKSQGDEVKLFPYCIVNLENDEVVEVHSEEKY